MADYNNYDRGPQRDPYVRPAPVPAPSPAWPRLPAIPKKAAWPPASWPSSWGRTASTASIWAIPPGGCSSSVSPCSPCGIGALIMFIWGVVDGVRILDGRINIDANGVYLKD